MPEQVPVPRVESDVRALTRDDGVRLFARFAHPPNRSGHPENGGAPVTDPTERAVLCRQFTDAWPYLRLIAGANRLDPLDRRVVEAYWIGNSLLDAVSPADVTALPGGLEPGLQPLHNAHVFCVEPWSRMLRAGGDQQPLELLDRCRIRWGEVIATPGDRIRVVTRSLLFDGERLTLGMPRIEHPRVGPGDGLRPGDVVALHWDWVCTRLRSTQLRTLWASTDRLIAAANAAREGEARHPA